MNIVDVNVLLYAVNVAAAQHAVAHQWLTRALAGPSTVGLAWVTLLGFVRISTHASVLPRPLSAGQAFDAIDAWLAAPACVIPNPTPRHRHILRGLLATAGTAGNLATDAHLAALATEYGGTVVTFDRDLARFGIPIVVPGT